MHYCFFTISDLSNAGLVRQRGLGPALIERGVEVSYLIDDTPENRASTVLHPKARRCFVAKPRSAGQFFRRRQILSELRPDYVEVLNPMPKTVLSLVGTSHNIVGVWDEPPTFKNLGLFRNTSFVIFDRWLRRRSVLKVVCTRYLQTYFRDRFGDETLYSPHAAYLPDFRPTASPFGRPTAVYLGNLYPTWDHDLIFQAALALKQRGLQPPIVIIGGGPDVEHWREFSRQNGLDNLTLTGPMHGQEMFSRLRHAHVLLFPHRDTLGNVSRCPSKTFAYAQARRPIITNRVGEVAAVLGDAAWYIDCTPDSFADAIAKAMATPDLPDVDFQIERQNWGARADDLLAALAKRAGR